MGRTNATGLAQEEPTLERVPAIAWDEPTLQGFNNVEGRADQDIIGLAWDEPTLGVVPAIAWDEPMPQGLRRKNRR